MDLTRLNEQQKKAVMHVDGPLLVLAGAGTGKTTVITFRVVNMIERGILPENILAVTFTNKAAKEMKERLYKLLPHASAERLTMSTFHSFGCRVLRMHAKDVGRRNDFGIADEGDAKDVVKEILANHQSGTDVQNVPYFISAIGNAKNELKEPSDLMSSPRSFVKEVGDVYGRYEDKLKQLNLLDFDDLLRLTVQLWERNPKILRDFQDRYKYLLVDEYQDTNSCQARLLELLAGKSHNVCVVGDDDQSIYGWRGADVDNILNFPNKYPNATVIKLEENYRSTNNVLEAANFVIAHNSKRHGKALWSNRGDGSKIRLFRAMTGDDEAGFCSKVIREFHHTEKIAYGDVAILYRSNHLSRRFEHCLRKMNLPYRVVGSKGFYERREIKDAAAFLRIVANPYDDLAFRRIVNVPPRGIGAKSMEVIVHEAELRRCSLTSILLEPDVLDTLSKKAGNSLRRMAEVVCRAREEFAEIGDLGRKIYDFLDDLGYLDGLKLIYKNHEESLVRRDNVLEFVVAANAFDDSSLQDFLEASSLVDTQDKVDEENDEEGNGVSLMTIHAAKGLEFSLVFVVGMEQGLFPHERAMQDGGLDEERRLFYVAMTRAKRHLFLSRVVKRETYGKSVRTRQSQFVHELPEHLLDVVDMNDMFKPASQDEISDAIREMKERLNFT